MKGQWFLGCLWLRLQWVLMLSSLKIKPWMPQNDEKSMSVPFVGVSKKGFGWPGRVMSLSTGDWSSPLAVHRCLQNLKGGGFLSFFCWGFLTFSEVPETDKSWKALPKMDEENPKISQIYLNRHIVHVYRSRIWTSVVIHPVALCLIIWSSYASSFKLSESSPFKPQSDFKINGFHQSSPGQQPLKVCPEGCQKALKEASWPWVQSTQKSVLELLSRLAFMMLPSAPK